MADDVYALLRKRRELEALAPQRTTDPLVINAVQRRNEKRRIKTNEACRRYREAHRAEVNERAKEYRNRPEVKARLHEYYLTHIKEARERTRKSAEKMMAIDPEGYRKRKAESARNSYLRHKDEKRIRSRDARRNESPEKKAARLEKNRLWKLANPDKVSEYQRRNNERRKEKRRQQRETEGSI